MSGVAHLCQAARGMCAQAQRRPVPWDSCPPIATACVVAIPIRGSQRADRDCWLDVCFEKFLIDDRSLVEPLFFCAEQDPQSSGRDSFLQPWAREISPLAHPPFKLIPRVLDKIRREGSQITLIAPVWGAAWWPQMMGMCRSPPVLLPRAPSLFWGTDKLPRFRYAG